MMVFSGFLVELSSIFSWLSWIQWISAIRYASNVLTINEFRHVHFCLSNMSDICPQSGSAVLSRLSLDHKTDWDLWKYFLALSLMTITFLILAFIQLYRIKKIK